MGEMTKDPKAIAEFIAARYEIRTKQEHMKVHSSVILHHIVDGVPVEYEGKKYPVNNVLLNGVVIGTIQFLGWSKETNETRFKFTYLNGVSFETHQESLGMKDLKHAYLGNLSMCEPFLGRKEEKSDS